MVSTSSSGFHGRHSWIPGCSRTHLHDHDLAHWTLQFQSLCHTLGLTLWSHPTDGLLPTTFSTLWIYCYAYHKHCGDYDTSSVFQSMNQPVVTDQTDAFHCWKKTVHNLTETYASEVTSVGCHSPTVLLSAIRCCSERGLSERRVYMAVCVCNISIQFTIFYILKHRSPVTISLCISTRCVQVCQQRQTQSFCS